MAKNSKSTLDGKIITIRRGLAIYKTHASPYWWARIRDPRANKYVVRTTKEKSRVIARQAAEELASALVSKKPTVPARLSFKHYAIRFQQLGIQLVDKGERNKNYIRTSQLFLDNKDWGLMRHFGDRDIRSIKTKDWGEFRDGILKNHPTLSSSTLNMLSATLRNVLKIAREDGVIDDIPDTPRARQKDKARPFFRFYPLVSKEDDIYSKLLKAATEMAEKQTVVRGVPTTWELYNVIVFCTNSFVRPTTTELYALRHNDIQIADKPERLLVTIRSGKTGFRVANTMRAAAAIYKQIKEDNPNAKGEDYVFFPQYRNRQTASRIFQRQFNAALEQAGIKYDRFTMTNHSVYSLRHTAICMRIIRSEGKVNIFNLAKNAGTSVDQIERFYARHLPLSAELAKNLQSFGGE